MKPNWKMIGAFAADSKILTCSAARQLAAEGADPTEVAWDAMCEAFEDPPLTEEENADADAFLDGFHEAFEAYASNLAQVAPARAANDFPDPQPRPALPDFMQW